MRTTLQSETVNQLIPDCFDVSQDYQSRIAAKIFRRLPQFQRDRRFGLSVSSSYPLGGLLSFRHACRDVYRFLARLRISGIGCTIYPKLFAFSVPSCLAHKINASGISRVQNQTTLRPLTCLSSTFYLVRRRCPCNPALFGSVPTIDIVFDQSPRSCRRWFALRVTALYSPIWLLIYYKRYACYDQVIFRLLTT